jgi:hypothetical protein
MAATTMLADCRNLLNAVSAAHGAIPDMLSNLFIRGGPARRPGHHSGPGAGDR